jgi:16S rRNA (guanine527-N7)-methyltransferase
VEQIEKSNSVEVPETWFKNVCAQNGFEIESEKLNTLSRYADLLLEWNQKINLISRKDEANIWKAHLLHAISPLMFLKLPVGINVLDLGTGGGLPGIPIKILQPEMCITLLDSTKKKIDAVADMVQKLELANVHAVWGRAEELVGMAEYKQSIDIVIARAVAPLSDLVKWSLPFLRQGTGNATSDVSTPALITLKGGDLQGEVGEIRDHKRIKNIRIIDLVFKNLDLPELQDKKIVVVEFTKAKS